jgi:hypothetical protein
MIASSSQIKAVILDYGEVLCYPPTPEEWARMARLFIEPVPFRKLWDRNRLLYDRGPFARGLLVGGSPDAGTQLAPSNSPSPVGCRDVGPRESHHGGVVETGSFLRMDRALSNMPHI